LTLTAVTPSITTLTSEASTAQPMEVQDPDEVDIEIDVDKEESKNQVKDQVQTEAKVAQPVDESEKKEAKVIDEKVEPLPLPPAAPVEDNKQNTKEVPEDNPNMKEIVLQTTSQLTGGFRKYVELPPAELLLRSSIDNFLHGHFEVRVRRHGFLFDHETKWKDCTVILLRDSKLLFVYMTKLRGYLLRIEAASRYSYLCETMRCEQDGHLMGYQRVVQELHYSFGELHIRMPSHEANVHEWRSTIARAQLTTNMVKLKTMRVEHPDEEHQGRGSKRVVGNNKCVNV